MDNTPLIELEEELERELKSLVDPSLRTIGGYSSGIVEFKFDSEILSKLYPELFYLYFNRTRIKRRGGRFALSGGFKIGHKWSKAPERVPGWETRIIGRQTMTVGLLERNIDEAYKRGLLSTDEVGEVAKDTFMLVFPNTKKVRIDYEGVREKIDEEWGESVIPFATPSPEDVILMDYRRGLSHPVFSHLLSYIDYSSIRSDGNMMHVTVSEKKTYAGSVLLLPQQVGDLSELKRGIVGNFQKFYSALRLVLAKRGYPLTDLRA